MLRNLRSRVSVWLHVARTTIRLGRKHGLRGLPRALLEDAEEQRLDIERRCVGAPTVSFDGSAVCVEGVKMKKAPSSFRN